MLTVFLTIIAGIIALSLVSSLILGFIAIRAKNRENQKYRKRVGKAMERLKKETSKESVDE